jgi:hypothetical protein
MSEQEYKDPSGNTEQFRAFVRSTEPDAGNESRPVGLIVGVAVAVVVVIAVVVWLAVS